MLQTATFFSSLGVVLAVFSFPGKPRPAAVAPSGVFRVDAQHSDAQMITDATTNYGRNKITCTTGIARITGKVSLDDANPEKSSFDITMYPATSVELPINDEGRVKTEWLASFAYQTLVCFHSKGAYITPDGRQRMAALRWRSHPRSHEQTKASLHYDTSGGLEFHFCACPSRSNSFRSL